MRINRWVGHGVSVHALVTLSKDLHSEALRGGVRVTNADREEPLGHGTTRKIPFTTTTWHRKRCW